MAVDAVGVLWVAANAIYSVAAHAVGVPCVAADAVGVLCMAVDAIVGSLDVEVGW
ncbi:hypothetical protein K525DRAFT_259291 [Schizophyllum commune Loenen D]|nr:hypothetical protein K525DRAFT_259291 [Schizophyllum commune Loenen D]